MEYESVLTAYIFVWKELENLVERSVITCTVPILPYPTIL